MEPQVIGSLIGGIIGFGVAAMTLVLGYRERKQSRRDDNIFRALAFFDGKTQRRNVGISVVEGYWNTTPDLQRILVPLLVNQAIYLVSQSEQSDVEHELNNWQSRRRDHGNVIGERGLQTYHRGRRYKEFQS